MHRSTDIRLDSFEQAPPTTCVGVRRALAALLLGAPLVIAACGDEPAPAPAEPETPSITTRPGETGSPVPGTTGAPAPARGVSVVLEQPTISVGDVEPESLHPAVFRLVNNGSETARVLRVAPNCKCTDVSNIEGRTIAPGESLELAATLKAPAVPGPKDAKVSIVIEGMGSPLTATISGVVTPPLLANPSYIGGARGGQAKGNVLIRSRDGQPFRILSAGAARPLFLGFDPARDEPRAEYSLAWTVAEIPEVGRRRAFTVVTDRDDYAALPIEIRSQEFTSGRVTDTGRMTRHWIAEERGLSNVGAITVGETREVSIGLEHYNPQGRGRIEQPTWLEVRGVRSLTPGVEATFVRVEPKSLTDIVLVFTVTATRPGPIDAFIEVETATGRGELNVFGRADAAGG